MARSDPRSPTASTDHGTTALAVLEKSTLSSIRNVQHKDANGNVIGMLAQL